MDWGKERGEGRRRGLLPEGKGGYKEKEGEEDNTSFPPRRIVTRPLLLLLLLPGGAVTALFLLLFLSSWLNRQDGSL